MFLIKFLYIIIFILFAKTAYSNDINNNELDGRIIFGVYIYDYNIKEYAEKSFKLYINALNEHLDILKKSNIDAVYMSISDPKDLDLVINLFEYKKMKIIPQLNFAYFNKEWSDLDIDIKAKTVGSIIKKYNNNKTVIGWSLKEEAKQEEVSKLSKYYKKILNIEPEARFVLIHNNLAAAVNFPEPYPYIEGVDRYGFWWEFSGGGYLASPSFALNWTRENFAMFYEKISKRTQNFMTVVTQGGLTMPNLANKQLKFKGETIFNDDKPLSNKIQKFANEGRMGWKKFITERGIKYNFWKYYRLPENCMKALMWSSVMEGSKYLFCWSYMPLSADKEILNFENAASLEKNEVSIWTLAGRKGRLNPQLKELTEAASEIKKYERVISNSSKLSKSKLVCKNENFYNREFKNHIVEGSVFIVHNSNVGTVGGDDKKFFNDNSQVYIDDDGNLQNYKPFKSKMICNIVIESDRVGKLYNMDSFKELKLFNNESQIEIAPGSGVLLFYGSEKNFKYLKNTLLK